MTPILYVIVAFAATLGFLFALAFVALILSVRRAQEKIDEQQEIIGNYRAERAEAIADYRKAANRAR